MVRIDTHFILLEIKGILTGFNGPQLMVAVEVGPSPQATVDDVGQTLTVGHLKTPVQWPERVEVEANKLSQVEVTGRYQPNKCFCFNFWFGVQTGGKQGRHPPRQPPKCRTLIVFNGLTLFYRTNRHSWKEPLHNQNCFWNYCLETSKLQNQKHINLCLFLF